MRGPRRARRGASSGPRCASARGRRCSTPPATQRALVVVDVAAPIEEDEELAFDRVPYRRNLMTLGALAAADEILLVVMRRPGRAPARDRRAPHAGRRAARARPEGRRRREPRASRAARRLQDCSAQLSEWTGRPTDRVPAGRAGVRAGGLGGPAAADDRAAVAVAARPAGARRGRRVSTTELSIVARSRSSNVTSGSSSHRRELRLGDRRRARRLVDEVVVDYRDRYLSGGLPPLTDEDVELLHHRIGGFGALTRLLDDPEVEEIWINEPGRVFVARRRRARAHDRRARVRPRSRSSSSGCSPGPVDGSTARSRSSTRGCPTAAGCTSSSRRSPTTGRSTSASSSVCAPTRSTSSSRSARARRRRPRSSTPRCGPGCRSSWPVRSAPGKTTLLNCLASADPGRERIVTCEEVFELRIARPDVVAMQCRQPNLEGEGAVTLRDLVRESLRMRPDRHRRRRGPRRGEPRHAARAQQRRGRA